MHRNRGKCKCEADVSPDEMWVREFRPYRAEDLILTVLDQRQHGRIEDHAHLEDKDGKE